MLSWNSCFTVEGRHSNPSCFPRDGLVRLINNKLLSRLYESCPLTVMFTGDKMSHSQFTSIVGFRSIFIAVKQ